MVKSVYMCAVCVCELNGRSEGMCPLHVLISRISLPMWRVRVFILNEILDTLLQWIPVTQTHVIKVVFPCCCS